MELTIDLIVLIALILLIRKAGTTNLQPLQNIPQLTSNPQLTQPTQNIPQNPQPQNNSNTLDTITKAGLIGTAAGLGMIGAGMLLNRSNYYDYYGYKPDTSLAEHLHDLIWNDGCCKCDNDVI